MHQTTVAIQEGKTRYEAADFITNLNANDIQEVLNGYIPGKRALSKAGRAHIIDELRKARYALKDYNETIESFNILGLRPTDENAFRKSYISGVSDRMHKDNRINRITIEIEYPEDTVPSIKKRIDDAIRIAMSEHNCCCTDNFPLPLDTFTEAIVYLPVVIDATEHFEDISCHCIKELNKPLTNSKTIWRGKYFVFTHGYIMRDDNKYMIYNDKKTDTRYKTHKINKNSLLCTIANDELVCTEQPDQEYADDEYNFIINEFKRFRNEFNKAMKYPTHTPCTKRLVLDELNS